MKVLNHLWGDEEPNGVYLRLKEEFFFQKQ